MENVGGNSGKTLGHLWENVRTFQLCLCLNIRAPNLLFLVKLKKYGKFPDLQYISCILFSKKKKKVQIFCFR